MNTITTIDCSILDAINSNVHRLGGITIAVKPSTMFDNEYIVLWKRQLSSGNRGEYVTHKSDEDGNLFSGHYFTFPMTKAKSREAEMEAELDFNSRVGE